jgi:oligopeptide transport system substrate-binding protein
MNPVGELTADCFVAAMEWVLNPDNMSVNHHNYHPRIVNAYEFWQREIDDPNEVGFRAIDRYTLEIVLNDPVPFFLEVAGFQPAYRPFLEEHGMFYGTDNDRTLYIGPFVLTEFIPGHTRVWQRNPFYWDAGNVHLEQVIGIFNAEMTVLAHEMFRRGEIDWAQITSDIVDMWLADPELEPLVTPGIPDHSFQWYYMFNFNPQFGDDYEPDNWRLAVNNEAFRQAVFWGLDSHRALTTLDPFNAELYLSNTITPRGFAVVDGVDYVDMAPLSRFQEYPDWLFNPERALEYRDQAIAELTALGATFPIIMPMSYNPNTPGWPFEVQVVSQQLVGLFGEDFINPVIVTGPTVDFLTAVRRQGQYAFMKGNNGFSVAPGDPSAWAFAFSRHETDDSWIHWGSSGSAETQRILEEYRALIDHANTITTKSQERWQAFNEAEYFLLSHAIVRPFYTIGSGSFVFRYNPFESFGANSGALGWIGRRMLDEPLTLEQWTVYHTAWEEERARRIAETPAIPIGDW